MLRAIAESLRYTNSQIGDDIFRSDRGVRQGGSSSCTLFVFYVDPLIKAIKSCDADGWLGDLSCLMFMDDTTLLATSRQAMAEKLQKLIEYCRSYGMSVNTKKTKYMAINTTDQDPFTLDGNSIDRVDTYCFLGASISAHPVSKQVSNEMARRSTQERKFYSFLSAHRDAPYSVKQTVWNSATLSAITYGAESWWRHNIKSTKACYMRTIKQLLGVRTQTSNDLCLVEAGLPAIQQKIVKRQRHFWSRTSKATWYNESPLKKALIINLRERSPMSRYFHRYISVDGADPVHMDNASRRQRLTRGIYDPDHHI